MPQETTLSITSSEKVTHTLKELNQLQEKREDELAGKLTNSIHDESDVDNDSSCPIYDRFYENGGSQN